MLATIAVLAMCLTPLMLLGRDLAAVVREHQAVQRTPGAAPADERAAVAVPRPIAPHAGVVGFVASRPVIPVR